MRAEWSVDYRNQVCSSERVGDPWRGICLEEPWEYTTSLLHDNAASSRGTTLDWCNFSRPPVYVARLWVPIPVALFSHAEYRIFRMKASIIFGGKDAPGFPPLIAQTDVVEVGAEHLSKEKHMDGKKLLPVCA